MHSLEGQVAVVTGASRGIGRAIALGLASRGMQVFAVARRVSDQLAAVVDEIRSAGGTAEALGADVSCREAVPELFARVERAGGRLDVCINNAAVGFFGPVAEIDASELDQMYATNVRGCFLCCREAMRIMCRQKRGYIINISSVVGFRGYPDQAGYAATKHAVHGLTKSLALEAQPHGIRVSTIMPGGVDTDMIRQSRPDLDPAELLKPDDILQAVLYLLSLSDQAAVDQIYIRRRASKPF